MTAIRIATALAAFALAPTLAIAHPLDGLSGAEMLRVTQILRAAGEANDETRYPLIELIEPAEGQGSRLVRGRSRAAPGPGPPARNETGFRTGGGRHLARRGRIAAGPAAGQPMVLFEEFTGAMDRRPRASGDGRRVGAGAA